VAWRISFGRIQRPLFLTYGVHHLQYFCSSSIVEFLEGEGFTVELVHRGETELSSLMRQGGIKSTLYNVALKTLFTLASLFKRQSKLILIARKN